MTIIIPMAGLSSRFSKAGYTLPKYMLYAKDKSLFNLAISSFEKYYKNCKFVFIVRDVYGTPLFVEEECKILGISDYKIVITEPTRGQAETVVKGIENATIATDESILIFNIDTFRPKFTFPINIESWDGYLECFVGEGDNWSYAKTEDGTANTRVIETAEKKTISNFCSTGIYYFKKSADFIKAYYENEKTPLNGIKELYVAPLYNILIHDGKNIHIDVIPRNSVIFCGVPDEYIEYVENM